MIRADFDEGGQLVISGVPGDSIAYIDAEWLPADPGGEVPALVAAGDGELAWCGGSPVQTPSGLDSAAAASLALVAVARAAVAAVEDSPTGAVDVLGIGVVALQVRALLAGRASARSDRFDEPRAVIDTTGDPAAIVGATRRLAALGTLVLAGEMLDRRAEMDLYPDVHVRGLVMVGVAPPLADGGSSVESTEPDELLDASQDVLTDAAAGTPLPPGAAWYRVAS